VGLDICGVGGPECEEIGMTLSHPNRPNARKNKPGGSCRMCKPWKHVWEHKFKDKDREEREIIEDIIIGRSPSK
jgi:hypothetical protein